VRSLSLPRVNLSLSNQAMRAWHNGLSCEPGRQVSDAEMFIRVQSQGEERLAGGSAISHLIVDLSIFLPAQGESPMGM
jgi:hypothetical protein